MFHILLWRFKTDLVNVLSPHRTALRANGDEGKNKEENTGRSARFIHLLNISFYRWAPGIIHEFFFLFVSLYEFTGFGCPGFKVF